jgi:hypothetical protein
MLRRGTHGTESSRGGDDVVKFTCSRRTSFQRWRPRFNFNVRTSFVLIIFVLFSINTSCRWDQFYSTISFRQNNIVYQAISKNGCLANSKRSLSIILYRCARNRVMVRYSSKYFCLPSHAVTFKTSLEGLKTWFFSACNVQHFFEACFFLLEYLSLATLLVHVPSVTSFLW